MSKVAEIGVNEFTKAQKEGTEVFNAVVKAYNIIDYVRDGEARQLAIVDCDIEGLNTTGITSVGMLDRIVASPNKEVVLTFTGTRYSEFAKEDQPTFNLKARA